MTKFRKPPPTPPAQADENCIRVRLDGKTIVLLKSMKAFASWKERYPNAELMDPIPEAGKEAGEDPSEKHSKT